MASWCATVAANREFYETQRCMRPTQGAIPAQPYPSRPRYSHTTDRSQQHELSLYTCHTRSAYTRHPRAPARPQPIPSYEVTSTPALPRSQVPAPPHTQRGEAHTRPTPTGRFTPPTHPQTHLNTQSVVAHKPRTPHNEPRRHMPTPRRPPRTTAHTVHTPQPTCTSLPEGSELARGGLGAARGGGRRARATTGARRRASRRRRPSGRRARWQTWRGAGRVGGGAARPVPHAVHRISSAPRDGARGVGCALCVGSGALCG